MSRWQSTCPGIHHGNLDCDLKEVWGKDNFYLFCLFKLCQAHAPADHPGSLPSKRRKNIVGSTLVHAAAKRLALKKVARAPRAGHQATQVKLPQRHNSEGPSKKKQKRKHGQIEPAAAAATAGPRTDNDDQPEQKASKQRPSGLTYERRTEAIKARPTGLTYNRRTEITKVRKARPTGQTYQRRTEAIKVRPTGQTYKRHTEATKARPTGQTYQRRTEAIKARPTGQTYQRRTETRKARPVGQIYQRRTKTPKVPVRTAGLTHKKHKKHTGKRGGAIGIGKKASSILAARNARMVNEPTPGLAVAVSGGVRGYRGKSGQHLRALYSELARRHQLTPCTAPRTQDWQPEGSIPRRIRACKTAETLKALRYNDCSWLPPATAIHSLPIHTHTLPLLCIPADTYVD